MRNIHNTISVNEVILDYNEKSINSDNDNSDSINIILPVQALII